MVNFTYAHFWLLVWSSAQQASVSWLCCILTLDRAINQRFLAEDSPVKISGSSHLVERKCIGVMKWDMQMPMWDTGRVSLSLGVSACEQKWGYVKGAPMSGWAFNWDQRSTAGLRLSSSRPRSIRSAKWGLEDNIAWYGEEKKLWVNMAVSIRLILSVFVLPSRLGL